MARIPLLDNQIGAVNPAQAGPDAFGFNPTEAQMDLSATVARAESLTNLTGTLSEIAIDRQIEYEASQRLFAVEDFRQKSLEQMTQFTQDARAGDPKTLQEYEQNFDALIEQSIQEHDGFAGSTNKLYNALQQVKSEYTRSMYGEYLRKQEQLKGKVFEQKQRAWSDMAGDMPESFGDVFQSIDLFFADEDTIETWSDPVQRDTLRQQAYVNATSSAMYTLNQRADMASLKQMQQIIANDQVEASLNPDQMRYLKNMVVSREIDAARSTNDALVKINTAEAALGRPLTENEKLMALDMKKPSATRTIADKVYDYARFKMQVGEGNVTIDEIQQMYEIDEASRPLDIFKNTGTRESFLFSNADRFAKGETSQQEDDLFMQVANMSYGTKTIKNPLTKKTERVRARTLPPNLVTALAARGKLHHFQDPEENMLDDNNQLVPLLPDEERVYDYAGNLTEIVDSAQRVISGSFLDINADQKNFRRYEKIIGLTNSVIAALQQNTRFPEGERQMLKEEITMIAGILKNPARAEAMIADVDAKLNFRQGIAEIIANSSSSTPRQREDNIYLYTLIRNVRNHLGAPAFMAQVAEEQQGMQQQVQPQSSNSSNNLSTGLPSIVTGNRDVQTPQPAQGEDQIVDMLKNQGFPSIDEIDIETFPEGQPLIGPNGQLMMKRTRGNQ